MDTESKHARSAKMKKTGLRVRPYGLFLDQELNPAAVSFSLP